MASSSAEVFSVRLVGFLFLDFRVGAGAFSAGVLGIAGGGAVAVTGTVTVAGGDFCFIFLFFGVLFVVLGFCFFL